MADNWVEQFEGLGQLAPDILQRLLAHGQVVTLAAGMQVFGPGSAPESFLLVLDGAIRVQQVSESGREIVLYRVSAGQSCTLTVACLMSFEDYLAEAIVEEDVRAVAIPRSLFDDLIAESPHFRRFVFTAFSERVTGLFRLVQEVAFERIDIRLAHRLVALSGSANSLSITHQQLAAELGSAREVVSRQLAEFQRRGWIASARGNIRFRNKDAIQRLAVTD